MISPKGLHKVTVDNNVTLNSVNLVVSRGLCENKLIAAAVTEYSVAVLYHYNKHIRLYYYNGSRVQSMNALKYHIHILDLPHTIISHNDHLLVAYWINA